MTWIVKGLPFSRHQSSCSNTKPTSFSWDDDIDLDVELWVDYALEEGVHTPREKKYISYTENSPIYPHMRIWDH